jgi:hypothetical protein
MEIRFENKVAFITGAAGGKPVRRLSWPIWIVG